MARRGCCRAAAFCWRCPRSPGARRGNMASAPIATASSTPAMRSAPWRRPPPRSAGAPRLSPSRPTPRSRPSSASIARTPAHRREPEHPDLLMWISTEAAPAAPALDLFPLIDAPREFHGAANRLSEDHDGWPVIDLAGQFCRKPRQAPHAAPARAQWSAPAIEGVSIGRAVRKRRSAQRMDGVTTMPRETFAALLAATLPSETTLLSAFPWADLADAHRLRPSRRRRGARHLCAAARQRCGGAAARRLPRPNSNGRWSSSPACRSIASMPARRRRRRPSSPACSPSPARAASASR